MDIVLMMIRCVADEVVARSRIMPLAMMTMMVMMVMVMMMMVMMTLPTVLVIQRRGGSRCWSQSKPTRTGRCATGTLAQSRGGFNRLHLRFHQSSEDGFETCHLHSTATIVRRDCLVSDIGSRRSHRHLFTCSCHITFTTLDGDHFVVRTVAGLFQSPLPERSQNRHARVRLPLLLSSFFHDTIHWKLSYKSGQHEADYVSLLRSFTSILLYLSLITVCDLSLCLSHTRHHGFTPRPLSKERKYESCTWLLVMINGVQRGSY